MEYPRGPPVVKQSTIPVPTVRLPPPVLTLPPPPRQTTPVVLPPPVYTTIPTSVYNVTPPRSTTPVILPTIPTVESSPVYTTIPQPVYTIPTVPAVQPTMLPIVPTFTVTPPKKTHLPQNPPLTQQGLDNLFRKLDLFFASKQWRGNQRSTISPISNLIKESISTNKPIWSILLDGLNTITSDGYTASFLIDFALRYEKFWFNRNENNGEDGGAYLRDYEYEPFIVKGLMYLILISGDEIQKNKIFEVHPDANLGIVYDVTQDQYIIVSISSSEYLQIFPIGTMIRGGSSSLLDQQLSQFKLGKLPIEEAIKPPSLNLTAFSSQLELFNDQAAKLDLPCYMYTLKILNQLKGRFLDGVINVSNKSYKVNRSVMTAFSSYFAKNFTIREDIGRNDIEFNPFYEQYLIEYIKYLDGDSHTLLDVNNFSGNFNFAVYIQDRLLAMNQLLAFFDNLEELEFTEGQVAQIQVDITTFLKTLPK